MENLEEKKESEEYYGEFSVFDVGQGNAQWIFYPDYKIGFLYDAGSTSAQKHFKFFSALGEKELFLIVQQKLMQTPGKDPLQATQSSNEAEKKNSNFLPPISQTSNSKLDSESIPDIKENIHDVIINSGAQLLFIILSHPDKDHINFLSQSSAEFKFIKSFINQNPKNQVCILACGGFISNDSQDVQKFLKNIAFIKSFYPSQLQIFFPYIWDMVDLAANEVLLNDEPEEFLKTLEKNSLKNFIQMDFLEFFNKKITPRYQKFKKFISTESPLIQKKSHAAPSFLNEDNKKNIQKLESKVFIWGMNYRNHDPNAQSTVMSFKLRDDMSLTVTGDAEPSTFEVIREVFKKRGQKKEDILGTKRLLVIPHHGAENNISKDMMNLFSPHLAIISAANGKQYGHPKMKVIHWLQECMNIKQFFDYFSIPGNMQNTNSILCFGDYNNQNWYDPKYKTSKAKDIASLVPVPNIFSTNTSGTISFKNGFFNHSFSSVRQYKEKSYLIDFSQSIFSEEVPLSLEGGEIILTANKNFTENHIRDEDILKNINENGTLSFVRTEKDKKLKDHGEVIRWERKEQQATLYWAIQGEKKQIKIYRMTAID
jgi:beta-lactamase superfamily II metal-dependent hydrolase